MKNKTFFNNSRVKFSNIKNNCETNTRTQLHNTGTQLHNHTTIRELNKVIVKLNHVVLHIPRNI